MKRVTAVALALLTGGAFAMPMSFVDSLIITPSLKSTDKAVVGCTDFNGAWTGSCKSEGKDDGESFTIKQQGCEMLEIESSKGKSVLPIGGSFSAGGAIPGSPAMIAGGHIESHWSKDLSVLQFTATGGMKKLVIDEGSEGGIMMSTARLVGGKLLIDLQAHSSKGSVAGSCEFTKTN